MLVTLIPAIEILLYVYLLLLMFEVVPANSRDPQKQRAFMEHVGHLRYLVLIFVAYRVYVWVELFSRARH